MDLCQWKREIDCDEIWPYVSKICQNQNQYQNNLLTLFPSTQTMLRNNSNLLPLLLLFFFDFYNKHNGSTNKRGKRNGKTQSDVPQVTGASKIAIKRIKAIVALTKKHPPRCLMPT